jgi:hypothetical protein
VPEEQRTLDLALQMGCPYPDLTPRHPALAMAGGALR